jgi:CRISPR-associated protein Cas2
MEEELETVVAFDVPSNRLRTRLGEACLDYGLERAQKSLFRGRLPTRHRRALVSELRERIGEAEVKMLILSLCARDVAELIEIVTPPSQSRKNPPDGLTTLELL